jgi:Zn-dependent protease with chaperone function
MDFFERQEKAHRNTKLLVVYFLTGVVLLIVTSYLALALIFAGVGQKYHRLSYDENGNFIETRTSLWNPKLLLGVAIGTLAVIAIGSASKTAELSSGGSAVAEMLGGRLVNQNTTDPDERKLLNVVEEMAIASGVPMPQVFVLDAEDGINAFAAGHSTSDAAVTVTRGCMKLLTRDQLQGVIGHEFSHILNGDMRLNIRLMGIIFGILCLAIIGRVLLQTGRYSSNRKGQNPLPLIGLVLIAFGGIGVFFGRLIQAAVSRQREFLADASSVQFTRNPSGLSGALQKIGAHSLGSHIESPQAEQASHMFFGDAIGERWFSPFATHPPIAERIRAIDPAWDGKFPPLEPALRENAYRDAMNELETSKSRPFPPIIPGLPQIPGARAGQIATAIITAQTVFEKPGNVTTDHLRYASELRDSFPPEIQSAARDPLGASALIYGLLLSDDPAMRAKQLDLLAQNTSAAIRRETELLLPGVDEIARRAKLPLVDLSLPALRAFSPAQYEQFSRAIEQLIEADGEIDLFEYVVQKIVLRHLDPQFNGARKTAVEYYALKPLLPDCAVLLSALAHLGDGELARQQKAFQQGAAQLSYVTQTGIEFVPAEKCDLSQVDTALDRLCKAAPQIKKNLLNACAQTVAADGVIQETEAEMLRAIADTLDCPLPPFLETEQPAISRN